MPIMMLSTEAQRKFLSAILLTILSNARISTKGLCSCEAQAFKLSTDQLQGHEDRDRLEYTFAELKNTREPRDVEDDARFFRFGSRYLGLGYVAGSHKGRKFTDPKLRYFLCMLDPVWYLYIITYTVLLYSLSAWGTRTLTG